MIGVRASLLCQPDHKYNVASAMMWAIRRSLTADYLRKAKVAMEKIGTCLEKSHGTPRYLQGAYIILKRCYRHTLAQQHHPSREDPEKFYEDYTAIYQQEDLYPSGWPVPIHINPF